MSAAVSAAAIIRIRSAPCMRKHRIKEVELPRDEDRSAAPWVPKTTSIQTLRTAANDCRGCDLYKTATQVVFGEGPKAARVMFVGRPEGSRESDEIILSLVEADLQVGLSSFGGI